MVDQPNIAYLTMAHNPMLTKQAIISALNQDYPDECKTIYLIHQQPFPQHIKHSLPIKIKEFNVKCPLPTWWFFKLKKFLEVCSEDYIVWFDEDDMYEPKYTQKALAPILTGAADVTWNIIMTFIQRTQIINNAHYSVAVGTSAGKIETFRAAFKLLAKKYPRGCKRPGGTLDPPYSKALKQCGRFIPHLGIRYYFFHKGAYTSNRRRGKLAVESVDYVPLKCRQVNSGDYILPFAGHDIVKPLKKK